MNKMKKVGVMITPNLLSDIEDLQKMYGGTKSAIIRELISYFFMNNPEEVCKALSSCKRLDARGNFALNE